MSKNLIILILIIFFSACAAPQETGPIFETRIESKFLSGIKIERLYYIEDGRETLIEETTFLNDLIHGPHKSYYRESGILKVENNFKDLYAERRSRPGTRAVTT